MKSISIIVPVYNVENYLGKCVESILNQTFKDFELILVDDGSSDKSGVMCDQYKEQDKRIKVIHKENGGLSSARNAGLEVAEGEYIGFIDSDDWIMPDMYQFLYDMAIISNADIAQCGFRKVDEKGYEYSEDSVSEGFVTKQYTGQEAIKQLYGKTQEKEINFLTWNKLYRSTLFSNLHFSEGKNNEDVIMTSKILTKIDIVVVNNKPQVNYLQRNDSIMGAQRDNKVKMLLSHARAYEEVIDYYRENGIEELGLVKKVFANYLLSLMKYLCFQKINEEAKEYIKYILKQKGCLCLKDFTGKGKCVYIIMKLFLRGKYGRY